MAQRSQFGRRHAINKNHDRRRPSDFRQARHLTGGNRRHYHDSGRTINDDIAHQCIRHAVQTPRFCQPLIGIFSQHGTNRNGGELAIDHGIARLVVPIHHESPFIVVFAVETGPKVFLSISPVGIHTHMQVLPGFSPKGVIANIRAHDFLLRPPYLIKQLLFLFDRRMILSVCNGDHHNNRQREYPSQQGNQHAKGATGGLDLKALS